MAKLLDIRSFLGAQTSSGRDLRALCAAEHTSSHRKKGHRLENLHSLRWTGSLWDAEVGPSGCGEAVSDGLHNGTTPTPRTKLVETSRLTSSNRCLTSNKKLLEFS